MMTTNRRPAIVLVEDNPDDEALRLRLRAFRTINIGNEVVAAHDGAEALELLLGPRSEEIVPTSCVDLDLPTVDGREVLRRLREDGRTRLLPVVVLTSSKHDEDMLQSYAEGANAFVRKPVDFRKFGGRKGPRTVLARRERRAGCPLTDSTNGSSRVASGA